MCYFLARFAFCCFGFGGLAAASVSWRNDLASPGAQQGPPLGLHVAIATSSSGGLAGGQVLVGHGV